jgi:hypothetical protein
MQCILGGVSGSWCLYVVEVQLSENRRCPCAPLTHRKQRKRAQARGTQHCCDVIMLESQQLSSFQALCLDCLWVERLTVMFLQV